MKSSEEEDSKMHFIKELVVAKIGRLEEFIRLRKEEWKQIVRQDYSDQTTFLLDMIRTIVPECQGVEVKVVDQAIEMNCMINNLNYSIEMNQSRSPQKITEMLIDQIVLPYTLDLWERLEKRRGEKEESKFLI